MFVCVAMHMHPSALEGQRHQHLGDWGFGEVRAAPCEYQELTSGPLQEQQ